MSDWPTRDITGRGADLARFDAEADGLSLLALRPRLVRAWVLGGSQDALGTERWTALFRRVGYTRDGVPCALPEAPVRLWRGGHQGAGRMAWTTDRAVAEGYAADPVGGPHRRPLWTTVAPVAALLAERTGDAEVVMDPALLGSVDLAGRADPFREQRAPVRPGLRMRLVEPTRRRDAVMGGGPLPTVTLSPVMREALRQAQQPRPTWRAAW